MNSVYFLIPGLRLPPEVLPQPALQETLTPLLTLTEGAGEVISQELVHDDVLDGAAHLVWLWQVIAKRSGMPETAAFEWEADGGPAMGAQTWRLHTVHKENQNGSVIFRSPTQELTAEERDSLHDEILACVRNYGFQLQQWADRWYLTRNQDWPIAVRPWCAQKYQVFSDRDIEGPVSVEFKEMMAALEAILQKSSVNVNRKQNGFDSIDSFWPDGGSRRHLLKPSTLRAVMANDSFVWGWAQNAGLLNFRTTPLKADWPEAPEGDLLAVIDDLYDYYRQGNWNLWIKTLPHTIEKLNNLARLAQARRANRMVIVASGARDTHTTVIEQGAGAKGFLARFKKKKILDWKNFLSEAAR